jgi:hypothetical protein
LEKEAGHPYPYVISWINRQRMGMLTNRSISKKDLLHLFPDACEETQDTLQWAFIMPEGANILGKVPKE